MEKEFFGTAINGGERKRSETNLNFGQALEYLKQGKEVKRKGMLGKVTMLKGSYPVAIENGASCPESFNPVFEKSKPVVLRILGVDALLFNPVPSSNIRLPQLAYIDNHFTDFGWKPNVIDLLAEDWFVLLPVTAAPEPETKTKGDCGDKLK